jgi:hypothetical protein
MARAVHITIQKVEMVGGGSRPPTRQNFVWCSILLCGIKRMSCTNSRTPGGAQHPSAPDSSQLRESRLASRRLLRRGPGLGCSYSEWPGLDSSSGDSGSNGQNRSRLQPRPAEPASSRPSKPITPQLLMPHNGYAHNLQASPVEGWSRTYPSSPDCTSDSRGSSATGAGGRSQLDKRPVWFRGWLCGGKGFGEQISNTPLDRSSVSQAQIEHE